MAEHKQHGHSPLPWSEDGYRIYDAGGKYIIAELKHTDEPANFPEASTWGNMQYIVRTANAYNEMVSILELFYALSRSRRLRLRNPTTPTEREVWATLRRRTEEVLGKVKEKSDVGSHNTEALG